MNPTHTTDSSVQTERLLSATPDQVFDAFRQPDKLARWWGPAGFTNTFQQFDFTPGGRWVFTMHGPDGADYLNENIFREIRPPARIVIEHLLKPWFSLTVTLTPVGDQTRLGWEQKFESPEVAATVRERCNTANEQVLDRLQAILAEG